MLNAAKYTLAFASALFSVVAVPVPAHAQDVGTAWHAGSLGLGADVALSVQPTFGLRASINFFPFDINFSEDDVDYRLELPSPQLALLADYYPAGQFRLSGGLLIKWTTFDVVAKLTAPHTIGDAVYTPEEVGNLIGKVDTNDVSPYLGIGFGNPTGERASFFFDLGVGFHGNPEASASADGPIGSDPIFQRDLDAEVQEIQDDLENVIVYPVLSLGISIPVGPGRSPE